MESVKEAAGDFNWTLPKARSQPRNVVDSTESKNSTTPEINKRKITLAHLLHAMGEVSPSVAPGGYSELLHWHAQFGKKTAVSTHSHLTCPQSLSVIHEGQSDQEDYGLA